MTIQTVVRDVCAAVGVAQPPSVFASLSTTRTMQEMVALANEMAQRIAADTRDWTRLKVQHVYTGDGVIDPVTKVITGTAAFELPISYQRMPVSSNVWRSSTMNSPMTFIPNTDEWLRRRAGGETDNGRGEWTIMGGRMHFWPILLGPITDPVTLFVTPAEKATFIYIDRYCVALEGGGYGDTFVADGDSFILGERLLKLGMVWQWKAGKGSPYAEDMGTYTDALANAMGFDSPAPILMGRPRIVGWRADGLRW